MLSLTTSGISWNIYIGEQIGPMCCLTSFYTCAHGGVHSLFTAAWFVMAKQIKKKNTTGHNLNV